jgi:LuxR family maltose regulon positive regulatory protein
MATQPRAGGEEAPLLRTKLYIPSPRPELVSRPRLIERLNAGIHGKLTVISAPAGFGKTTLVGEWVASHRRGGPRSERRGAGTAPGEREDTRTAPLQVAWLSLDEGDNDLTRFLTYLIAALQTVEDDLGRGALSVLQSPQPPPAEAILSTLINEVATIPDQIILVLDDYHLIEAQPINDALTFLLRRLPPPAGPLGGLHLVIATREDPPLPLARLRARRQLTELRATELRFTFSEVTEFLNQVMGLDLSTEDIAALESRTEGWIAGLQLAAISMQGRKDVAGFVQSFTGTHHFVLDYLVEEVLEQQPQTVQDFLLQTAILDRLTGSLCDAVTGQQNGQATLETLERANLFIVSLDEERRWYRYHHLFAELLQQRLNANHPDLIHDLHSKAATWYEMRDDLPEAIDHALAIDDVETAIRWMEKGALGALERSELRLVLNWVALLPEPALESSPWLFIYHAWALLLTGQVDGARSRLENIEWLLKAIQEQDETQKQEMLGFIAGLKAILGLWQRDFASGLDFARQALEKLPESSWIRGYCAIVMGSGFWGTGNLAAARDAYAESYSVGKASGNKMLAVSGACNLAYALELEGHLEQAVKLFQDSFQLAEQDGHVLAVAGYIHVELARTLYELNDLDAASQHLREGIELCQQLADGRAEKIGHCLLARVQLAQEKSASVLDSIQKAKDADPSPGTPFDLRGGEYPQVWLWLKENKCQELKSWLKESSVNLDDVSFFKTKLTYTMHARVLIALGRKHPEGTYLDDALDLLKELLELAEKNGWGSKVIEILVLQALGRQSKGGTSQAMATLERALTLAEPGGFIRVFVDEGSPMGNLLYQALGRGISPDYVRRLLAAFPDVAPEQAGPPSAQTCESDLIEPLSERELEVLALVAEGLTNREIASRLYLALNTVKAHTRNIYGKLGVHSRTQAVARARTLRLLPSI